MGKRKFQSQEEELRAKKKAILNEANKRRLDFETLEKQDRKTREGLAQCKDIFNKFKRLKESEPFLSINKNAPWFTRYSHEIKHIMDFKIIDKKYDKGKYKNAHELATDIRLMWDNAMIFNRPNEQIWKSAWKFCKEFEKQFKDQVLKIIGKTPEGETFNKVMRRLWSETKAHYFHEPVDYVQYSMPNYIRQVGVPMCFRKVHDRCYSYKDKKAFLTDLDRVFNNATVTNPNGSDVYETAVVLKRLSHDVLRTHLGDTGDDIDTDDGPVAGLEEEPGSSEEQDYELTTEQMEWLSEHFYELDEDRIQPIVDKLSSFSKQEGDEEEPTIDLQELPPKLLYEAYKYVKDSLRVQKQINQGAGISATY